MNQPTVSPTYSAIKESMAYFAGAVTAHHKPTSGAFFLAEGYLWHAALDARGRFLGIMAIKEGPEDKPLMVQIITVEAPHTLAEIDAEMVTRGVRGALEAFSPDHVADGPDMYPVLAAPCLLIQEEMRALMGMGNN